MNSLLREEISNLILTDMRDPRLASLVSITRVITSASLLHAKVYVSVMGDEQAQQQAIKALQNASSYISRGLGDHLTTKYTPYLHFILDDSIEKSSNLLNILNSVTTDRIN